MLVGFKVTSKISLARESLISTRPRPLLRLELRPAPAPSPCPTAPRSAQPRPRPSLGPTRRDARLAWPPGYSVESCPRRRVLSREASLPAPVSGVSCACGTKCVQCSACVRPSESVGARSARGFLTPERRFGLLTDFNVTLIGGRSLIYCVGTVHAAVGHEILVTNATKVTLCLLRYSHFIVMIIFLLKIPQNYFFVSRPCHLQKWRQDLFS